MGDGGVGVDTTVAILFMGCSISSSDTDPLSTKSESVHETSCVKNSKNEKGGISFFGGDARPVTLHYLLIDSRDTETGQCELFFKCWSPIILVLTVIVYIFVERYVLLVAQRASLLQLLARVDNVWIAW